MLSIDTETLGLCGPAVIYQYKLNNKPVVIYDLWLEPVKKTLDLLEQHCSNAILGFNLTFDWFQLCKINSMFSVIYERYDNIVPSSLSKEELIDIEYEARDGKSLRPKSVFDLYIHAQKGTFQFAMEREDIIIRKVPREIVYQLCNILNSSITFDPILFAGKKDKTPFKVFEFKDRKGNVVENFYNIVCIFKPSLSLKCIAENFGLVETATKFKEFKLEMPVELGFAPYAKAFYAIEEDQWETIKNYLVRANKTKKILDKLTLPYFGTWVNYLDEHINFWKTNEEARTYATNDVEWLPKIYEKFGSPDFDDDDSVLTCCVGAVRWHGFQLNKESILALREKAKERITACPVDYKAPKRCSDYVLEVATELEKILLGKKTGKVLFEALYTSGSIAGQRAKLVMDARMAKKEIDLYNKLLIAERLHASFRVIGALSGRMSGADGVNPHGINREGEIRTSFTLATPGFKLCLGDFSGQEVTIFEAISKDTKLRSDLLSGKKIHGLFGTFCFPHMTYEEIVNNKEIYNKSKSALFALLYGGEAETLRDRLGVPLDVAREAYIKFLEYYTGARNERLAIKDKFSPLRQDENKKVTWTSFEPFVESLYGFRRFFELEFYVSKKLFDLSSNLFNKFERNEFADLLVVRNAEKGPQKIIGAAMSSLYATAFNIQASVFRQAANHRIQSTGAQITKNLQRRFWDLQPVGSNKLVIAPMSVHDEIDLICLPEYCEITSRIVKEFLEEKRKEISLLDIEWVEDAKSWGDK